ncbi:autotransporter-associated beta strand repeat-containing protein [Haloferula sp. BvORR071]|uniref:beta strand repeat-containing protein n=1 Tax=Haloferula sp. BvORR071 TaxID=1396141 RepID=UPI0005519A8A|nr:autotransporter-associated beta strand repeat-containing protein [Haloferula sp. BvORR071]
MKQTPTTPLITRESLTATASHNARWFARLVVGGILSSAVSQAAIDNIWNGSVDSNWNTPGNWSFGHAPVKTGTEATNEHGVIDSTTVNIPTITVDMTPIPTDIILRGVSRLDHRSGIATTGGGNWMFVGSTTGSNSVYNLANTTTAGGGISGFAQGSGTMTANGGRLYVGGNNGGASTGIGKVNMNTTGNLNIGNRLYVGARGGNGTFNMESGTMPIGNDLALGTGGGTGVMTVTAGTITTGGWNFIGKNEDGTGSNGSLFMNGGTLTNTGRTYVGQNTCTGLLKLSGGDYLNVNNEQFILGEDVNSNGTVTVDNTNSDLQIGGELWIGQNGGTGVVNLSAGNISVGNWLAIGRANNATGTLNISGTGVFTKNSNQEFIVGSDGTGAHGTINQSGGTMNVGTVAVSIGRAGGSFGAYNLSAGTATLGGTLRIGEGGTGTLTMTGGALSAPNVDVATGGGSAGHIDFDGGTLSTKRINGGPGADVVEFNGTQITSNGIEPNFISNLDTAEIQVGGLKINSNGSPIGIPQILSGAGGLTKSGADTLTLTAANTYTGANTVNGGKLYTTTDSVGGGALTVANGASFGVTATFFDAQFNAASASFGTGGATSLDINYNAIAGNPSLAPVNVTGALTINGTATINLTGLLPQVGSFPLVKYNSTTGGTFTLGTLPPGIQATLVHDTVNKLYRLNITAVALRSWTGNFDNEWSTRTTTGTQNWLDSIANTPAFFANGNPVTFDNSLLVPANSAINIPGTVTPSGMTFDNTIDVDYSLSGAGQISGTGGLLKQNTGNLTISTANTYTGVTTLAGGTTSVATLAAGGAASPLGAAPAAPGNLVFAGGTLAYTGPATTNNRGYTVGAADNAVISTLKITNNLEISGQIARSLGGFVKDGAGTLTLSFPGANGLSNNGLTVAAGGLVLNGTGQTNAVAGPLLMRSGTVVSLLNNAALSVTGETQISNTAGTAGAMTLAGTSVYNAGAQLLIGTGVNGTAGSLTIGGSSTLNQTAGWLAVGHTSTSTGTLTVKENGTYNHTGNDFNVTDLDNSIGNFNLQDNGTVHSVTTFWGKNTGTVATVSISGTSTYTGTGSFFVALNTGSSGTVTMTGGTVSHTGGEFMISRDGLAVWNQSAGSVSANGWMILGRNATGDGTLNISGGTFTQTQLDRPLMVGEFGKGTVNMTGAAQVTSLGANGLILANEPSGTGTMNLDGGLLTVRRVREGNDNNGGVGGESHFNFDGGTLKAGANANANFMSSLNSAIIEDGGAIIDSNGQTINIGQGLDDDGTGLGGLTKIGAGTLNLNGTNTYLGTTTVSVGTLGGTGTIKGPISVSNGASLAPGAPTGDLFADGNVSFAVGGNFAINLSATEPTTGHLVATANLNITNANLVITGTPTASTYIIADYGTKTGTQFANHAAVSATLPSGYSINYAYQGGTQIAIVRAASAFETWANGFFPGETDPNIVGPNADPDGDGNSNALEFALGGTPNNGSSGPKVYNLIGDGNDAGTANELLLTIAVRSGAPVFAGAPSPTAAKDGYTYTVQGSLNLAAFTSPVTVVTPVVTTGLPAAPAGYEYRTFSLTASDGLAQGSKGFLRVNVTPTP